MRSFQTIAFLLSLIFLVFSANAQKTFLEGWVTNEDAHPVSSASINIFKQGQYQGYTYTSSNGHYIAIIDSQSDSITCSMTDYKLVSEKIQGNNIINFTLIAVKPIKSVERYAFAVDGIHYYTEKEFEKRKTDSLELIKKIKAAANEDQDRIFTKVVSGAVYPGGQAAMNKYLAQTIIYPDSALISDVKGTVKVKFIISIDGSVSKVSLVKGVNKYCDSAVIIAVSKMKGWKPAYVNGRPGDGYGELSVRFNIMGVMPENFKKKN